MRQLVDVVVPLGVFSVFIVMLLYMPRFFFVYRIGERGIRIKLFGIVTHARIWWTEIASVQVVPRGDASLFQERMLAHPLSKKRVVITSCKEVGFLHQVVLSPKDPDAFAREVLECMKRAQTEAGGDRCS
jgi:hypothetical protein